MTFLPAQHRVRLELGVDFMKRNEMPFAPLHGGSRHVVGSFMGLFIA